MIIPFLFKQNIQYWLDIPHGFQQILTKEENKFGDSIEPWHPRLRFEMKIQTPHFKRNLRRPQLTMSMAFLQVDQSDYFMDKSLNCQCKFIIPEKSEINPQQEQDNSTQPEQQQLNNQQEEFQVQEEQIDQVQQQQSPQLEQMMQQSNSPYQLFYLSNQSLIYENDSQYLIMDE